ncbi:MAG: purine-binding chemotaxis protein CheW [Candidatus Aureabacteria bacterium]|nr:purine-binding chemotaxis protein CheW [Candidatus Auribacterota bacterium]
MDKTITDLKNETYKLVDEIYPEVSESQLELDDQLFSRNELMAETTQYINFQIGREFYAFEISYVREVIKVSKISMLPSAGQFIFGLTNLRGNIIPVVNTHKLFGVPQPSSIDKLLLIIIEIDKSNLGFLGDSVSQVIDLRKEDIDPPMVTLEIEHTEYIVGETNIDGQLVAVLDIEKLVKNELFIKE